MTEQHNDDVDAEARMYLKTTKGRKRLFEMSTAVLHVDAESFFNTAMKNLVINALDAVENLGVQSSVNVPDARRELNRVWSMKIGPKLHDADALEV